MNQTIYTIGYGGRTPREFVEMLLRASVRTIVDVRLRPDRASMGSYARAKKDEKGITALLAGGGIRYRGLPELGNPFLDEAFDEDWQPRYEALLAAAAPLLMVRLDLLLSEPDQAPLCLMCAEKDPDACHRSQIARVLQHRGHTVVHLV